MRVVEGKSDGRKELEMRKSDMKGGKSGEEKERQRREKERATGVGVQVGTSDERKKQMGGREANAYGGEERSRRREILRAWMKWANMEL